MPNLASLQDLLSLNHVPASYTYQYAHDESQFAKLYLPDKGKNHPVIILIHGGCWQAKVKLDYFSAAAKSLSQKAYAVWNIEYRRLGNGGGYPETFLDLANAADYLRQLSKKHSLDLNKVIAVGHSAGGHLAHWLAARPKLEPQADLYTKTPLALKGFISLAGIPDLKEAVKRGICDDAATVKLMGGLPSEVAKRYQQGSPSELAPLEGKQVFIHGKQDDTVPHDYVEAYVKTAQQRGENVKLVSLDNTGHFELVMPQTEQWQSVQQEIHRILKD